MFRNNWLIAALSLLLGLGCSLGLIVLRLDAIAAAVAPPEVHEEAAFDPTSPVYWNRYFEHLSEMEEELVAERDRLKGVEEALAAKRSQLEDWRRELRARADKIDAARAEIREWFVAYSEAEQANFQRIAKTYAAMEPAAVVPILLATETQEVAKVLLEMKPEIVAPIWTALLDSSEMTEENALRVARLIEIMGRIHQGIGPRETSDPLFPADESLFPEDQATTVAPPGRGEQAALYDPQEIENFSRVARTYGVMEPAKVAPILLATPPREAAGVLMQMRPEMVAPIWTAIVENARQDATSGERVAAMTGFMRSYRQTGA